MKRRLKPALDIVIATPNTATVRGPGAHRVIRRAGSAAQYAHRPPDGGDPCWTIPAHAVADVIAAAEHLGGRAYLAQEALFS